MKKAWVLLILPSILLITVIMVACGTTNRSRIAVWESRYNDARLGRVTPQELLREVRLSVDLVRAGTNSRRLFRPMRPTFITIHSTQNLTGSAFNHALALRRGSLNDSWHFTVQDDIAIQHLPCREQGRHADYEGPGNLTSIGIEMCEHRGNDIGLTIDKTARLAAYLMYTYNIPLSHVVPHYHWPRIRPGVKVPHKNCPHFLLDGGRPSGTWRWFQNRVHLHYSRLIPGPAPTLG